MMRMMRGVVAVLFVVCALPVAAGEQGEQNEEVLTNDAIVKLTEAGLEPAGVLAMIAANRTDFDTSVEELVKLLQTNNVDSKVVAAMIAAEETTDGEESNFGDDDSVWARDGECDDPRFDGDGMARTLNEEDRGHDATDCRQLYRQGFIKLRSTP